MDETFILRDIRTIQQEEELILPKTYRYRRNTSPFVVTFIFIVLFVTFCLTGLIFLTIQLISNGYHQSISILFIVMVALLIIAPLSIGYAFIQALSYRLVLTDQGVIRYYESTVQFTPWSNILGIVDQAGKKGLRLKEPASCSNIEEGLQKNVPTLVVSKRNWAIWDLYASFFPIPKEISEDNWESGIIGAYIRKYAPNISKNHNT